MSPSTIQRTRPTVTLAMAAYNCAATVAATIESCLAQTYPEVEILVVDDGSTDATPTILARYSDRIRVIRQPNGGLASARNTAMRQALGEFIAWMDADDLCLPDRLLAQAAVLVAFADVVLVSSNFVAFRQPEVDDKRPYLNTYYSAPGRLGGLDVIYPRLEEVEAVGGTALTRFSVRRGHVFESLLEGNFVHPPTVMFRRNALPSAGDCDTSLRFSSDYEFFIRLSRLGEFALIEEPLLRYRISDTQMTKSAVLGTIQLETIAIMDAIRSEHPSVYASHRVKFENRYARSYLSAALAIGNFDRGRSLGLLLRGLVHRVMPREILRVLLHIFMPQNLRPAIQRMRRPRSL